MQISAEARWFWCDSPPDGLEEWFCKGSDSYCCAGGGEPRTDEYLNDSSQVELGVKRRGGKQGVEVKGLVSITWGALQAHPFTGPIELWSKWTSKALELKAGSTISVEKVRWLRKFDTTAPYPQEIPLDPEEQRLDKKSPPALGCNVELTKVKLLHGAIWWTLGFEAFGAIATVENDLRAVAAVLATRQPPDIRGGFTANYPVWLSQHAPQVSTSA